MKYRDCYVYSAENRMSAIESFFKYGEKHFVLYNSKESSEAWRLRLLNLGFNVLLINADKKDDEEVNKALESEELDPEVNVIIVTTFAIEGISFNNPDIKAFHIYDRTFGSSDLHQLASRARQPENPVRIIQWQSPNHEQYEVKIPRYHDVLKNAQVSARLLNQFISNSKVVNPSLNLRNFAYALDNDKKNILSAFSDRILYNPSTQMFEASRLGVAYIITKFKIDKECRSDEVFTKEMNKLGWNVHIKDEVFTDEVDLTKEFEIIRNERYEEVSAIIEEDIKPKVESKGIESFIDEVSVEYDNSVKAKTIQLFIALSKHLPIVDDIYNCLTKGYAKSIFEFARIRNSLFHLYLESILKVGDELDFRTRHRILDAYNKYISQKIYASTLAVKYEENGLINGISASILLSKHISVRERKKNFYKDDGSRSTARIHTVTELKPFKYEMNPIPEEYKLLKDQDGGDKLIDSISQLRQVFFPESEYDTSFNLKNLVSQKEYAESEGTPFIPYQKTTMLISGLLASVLEDETED